MSRITFHRVLLFQTYLGLQLFSISSLAAEPPSINCERVSDFTECAVNLANRQLLDVFELTGPRRLVMDLGPNQSSAKARIQLASNTGVVGVRSAAHPDKYRIVFDLAEEAGKVAWRDEGSRALLRLSAVTQTEMQQPVQADARAALAPQRVLPVRQQATITQPKVETPEPAPQVIFDTPESEGQVCSHIQFLDSADGQPAHILLNFSKYPAFSFSKATGRSYRLKVQGARLADSNLMRPFFPPHDFPGVAYVELKEDSKVGLVVDIGIERGTNLNALARNDGIIVQVMG